MLVSSFNFKNQGGRSTNSRKASKCVQDVQVQPASARYSHDIFAQVTWLKCSLVQARWVVSSNPYSHVFWSQQPQVFVWFCLLLFYVVPKVDILSAVCLVPMFSLMVYHWISLVILSKTRTALVWEHYWYKPVVWEVAFFMLQTKPSRNFIFYR